MRRMDDLGVEHCYIGKSLKIDIIKDWCKELQISAENIAFIGDDINDLEILKFVGVSACPSNAVEEVQSICDIILNAKGGKACVREFIDTYIGISFKGF
jgi:YrbI family 3-deoxy-D-manno-octulosonate 8-phosphate phosphatase